MDTKNMLNKMLGKSNKVMRRQDGSGQRVPGRVPQLIEQFLATGPKRYTQIVKYVKEKTTNNSLYPYEEDGVSEQWVSYALRDMTQGYYVKNGSGPIIKISRGVYQLNSDYNK